MRLRTSLVLGMTVFFALPAIAFATQIPFFGPIIPAEFGDCAAGWGGLVTVINNLISFAISVTIVFVAPVAIAYAGFLYVINPVNPSARTHANEILKNIGMGIVAALAAWLIVDGFMAVLYNPNAQGFGTQWYQLLFSNGQTFCLAEPLNSGFNPGQASGAGGNTYANSPLVNASQNPKTGCTTQDLTQYFGTAAAAMSCATRYENSTCNPLAPSGTDHTVNNEPVSTGLFQVNISTDNLNYPACLQAVGSSAPLNCTQVFTGPLKDAKTSKISIRPGMEHQYSVCIDAANSKDCNIAAAKSAYNIRLNRPGVNPLSAWGSNAQAFCSSLLPANRTLLSLLASVFFHHEK